MPKQEKIKEVEELRRLLNAYSVVGILNMHKLPARQLQNIRHSIEKTTIKMSKKTLMTRAIDSSNKHNLPQLKSSMAGSAALLFSNENPFRLFKKLKENRSPAPAKVGDVPAKDIVVQKGSTGLPPGPAISTLQKAGLKASVQGGKIAVLQDKVICKAGESVNEDVASVLGLLKIEPMEVGLDLVAVYEDGTIYSKDVLDVDLNDYINEILKDVGHAINLSLNTGYPTKFTIDMMIRKAFLETKSLCIEAGILEKDFAGDTLARAVMHARALERFVNR